MLLNSIKSNNYLTSILCLLFLTGLISCASAPSTSSSDSSYDSSASDKDPLQTYNRAMFGFNDGIDKILLKPVAKTYRFIMPDFVETGVSNVFSNLLELRSILNAGLQAKGKKTLVYTGRFLVNSTLGLGGILDVAKLMGMEKDGGEDFGQTLGVWGLGSGPYIVLPLLGPSTLRDTSVLPLNMISDPTFYIDHVRTSNATTFTKTASTRAGFLEAEKLITGDRYSFIRDAYLQRRTFLINDGKVEDSFGGDVPLDEDF